MANPNYDPERDAAGVEFLRKTFKQWESAPPVQIRVPRREAFYLIGVIQYATRGLDRKTAAIAENIGRQLQEQLSEDPEVYTMLETGWNPTYDVKQQDETG